MIICYEFFGKINHSFNTTMREEYAKIFNTLGKKEMGALESYIKSGGADAVGKRVLESVMKKASKATPHLSTERSTSAGTTIFPQRRNRHKICQNITTEDGYKALGMYKDKLITFAKNPSKNTIDHEAFHAYFDIALGKQKK